MFLLTEAGRLKSGKNKKLNIDLSQMFNFCVFKSIVDYSCVSASTALFASSSSESLASSLSLLRSERPSSIAAPNAFTKRETDLNASSFAGIGKSSAEKIKEFLETGKITKLEEKRAAQAV